MASICVGLLSERYVGRAAAAIRRSHSDFGNWMSGIRRVRSLAASRTENDQLCILTRLLDAMVYDIEQYGTGHREEFYFGRKITEDPLTPIVRAYLPEISGIVPRDNTRNRMTRLCQWYGLKHWEVKDFSHLSEKLDKRRLSAIRAVARETFLRRGTWSEIKGIKRFGGWLKKQHPYEYDLVKGHMMDFVAYLGAESGCGEWDNVRDAKFDMPMLIAILAAKGYLPDSQTLYKFGCHPSDVKKRLYQLDRLRSVIGEDFDIPPSENIMNDSYRQLIDGYDRVAAAADNGTVLPRVLRDEGYEMDLLRELPVNQIELRQMLAQYEEKHVDVSVVDYGWWKSSPRCLEKNLDDFCGGPTQSRTAPSTL